MHEIDYRAIETFFGKIKDKQRVGEMPMTLEITNSPNSLSVQLLSLSYL